MNVYIEEELALERQRQLAVARRTDLLANAWRRRWSIQAILFILYIVLIAVLTLVTPAGAHPPDAAPLVGCSHNNSGSAVEKGNGFIYLYSA